MDTEDISDQKALISKKFRSYLSNDNEDNLAYGFSKERVEGNILKKYKREKKTSLSSCDDEDSSTASTELTSLRPRTAVSNNHPTSTAGSGKHSLDNVVILEREILPTDTLQSFALLYGCTLNDLKRVNNLIKEQDFYALRIIKIPVKKYGLMTEPEEEMKRRPAGSSQTTITTSSVQTQIADHDSAIMSEVYLNDSQDEELSENQTLLQAHLSSPSNKTTAVDHNDASKYLKTVDKEIRNMVKSVHAAEKNETLEEVVSSLGSVGFQPLPVPAASATINECDGSMWGVTRSTVLLSIVFGLTLVGVFIVLRQLYGL